MSRYLLRFMTRFVSWELGFWSIGFWIGMDWLTSGLVKCGMGCSALMIYDPKDRGVSILNCTVFGRFDGVDRAHWKTIPAPAIQLLKLLYEQL